MNRVTKFFQTPLVSAIAALTLGAGGLPVRATEPCGDFGKCKVLVEINSSDGDIGFHFLGDADDLRSMRITGPSGEKLYENRVFGAFRNQKITENFGESAEPLCWFDPEEDELDDVVTLREFVDRWAAGTYIFSAKGENGEKLTGETELTFNFPAAPKDVEFDGSTITWTGGDDLGNCAPIDAEDAEENGVEPISEVTDIIPDPSGVPVAAFEVVLAPDVEDGVPIGDEIFSVRVSGATFAVDVPALYLLSLPADTPVKIEVGAIGLDDNATFTEADGFCINEDEGCEED
ncbi:hypothetical protein [Haliea sp. E17]|uniref:hypothetical protein n=1 Tax=Haliea sp. E17 TaxID=3401576 RepID=UPI003AAFB875